VPEVRLFVWFSCKLSGIRRCSSDKQFFIRNFYKRIPARSISKFPLLSPIIMLICSETNAPRPTGE